MIEQNMLLRKRDKKEEKKERRKVKAFKKKKKKQSKASEPKKKRVENGFTTRMKLLKPGNATLRDKITATVYNGI